MKKTKLRVIDSGRSMDFVLDDFGKDTVVVGRSAGCDIRLVNPKVSSSHGCFFKNQGQWCYQDMKSTNGSSMNGSSINSVTVRNGDKIFLESSPKENSSYIEISQVDGVAGTSYDNSYAYGGAMPTADYQSYPASGPSYQEQPQPYQDPIQPYPAPAQPYPAPVQPYAVPVQPTYVTPVYGTPYVTPVYAFQPKPPISALGVVSMILGILSFISSILVFIIFAWIKPFVSVFIGAFALVAIGLAIPSLAGHKSGKGMAIAGLVLGILALGRLTVYWIVVAPYTWQYMEFF